jgi:putative ABC transport system permease protein
VHFFNIKLAAGEDFLSNTTAKINPESYIINETAARMIGWNNPKDAVGQPFKPTTPYAQFEGGSIIGVVEDFGQSSLKKEIKPLLLFQRQNWFFCFMVKIESDKINSTLTAVRKAWNDINSDYPFQYYFIDDLFAQVYQGEKKQQQILGLFSILGVLIACMGLFGLITYTVERRWKEIGIRKVLGASVRNILQSLTKEFMVLVVIANIIAWPIAYYAMNKWLESFAYRTNIGITTFILAGFSALLIALLTVSYQAIKAARTNPVDAIKHE